MSVKVIPPYLKTILTFLNLTYIEEAICIFKKIVHFRHVVRKYGRTDGQSNQDNEVNMLRKEGSLVVPKDLNTIHYSTL